MSKNRYINTKFWDDSYIANLDPIEKLLFLYFLTNPLTNIIGVYEIQIKRVAFDTGIDKEMVLKIIQRFTRENKIFYIDNYIVIANQIKHQNQQSDKVQKGITRLIQELPQKIKKCVLDSIKGIDTLSYLTILNKDLTILNKDLIDTEPENPPPPKNKFKIIPPTIEMVKERFIELKYSDQSEKFFNYYESNGWRVGKNKMVDWSAAIVNWNKNNFNNNNNGTHKPQRNTLQDFS